MVYRESVEFLENANPALIDRNAEEFRRLHRLIESADGPLRKAAMVAWESEARDRYVKRLDEAGRIADALSAGFRTVWKALAAYADAVTTAKRHYESGKHTEDKLAEVISREAGAVTPTARAAEPLRQWEDLRGTTGFLDFVAELGVDLDAIREEAESYYTKTRDHYGDALRVESEAREKCVADIRAAHRSLPDFRGGLPDPLQVLANLGALRSEARQASDDPNVRLHGSGRKTDTIPDTVGNEVVSDILQKIRTRIDGLPEGQGNNYWLPSTSDEDRRAYISANKELIKAAARDSGLPPEMVAGIAWKEVAGDPGWVDDAAHKARRNVPGLGDADQTSMGPMAIQVRRAAEVLGYDPGNLTEAQRQVVVEAVKDPAQNIFIASEYLAQLKAESGFADVPPEQMTKAQMQELAARYNGGPYYESNDAQRYGRQFGQNLDEAKEALK